MEISVQKAEEGLNKLLERANINFENKINNTKAEIDEKVKWVQNSKTGDFNKTQDTFNKSYTLKEKEMWSEPNGDKQIFRNSSRASAITADLL